MSAPTLESRRANPPALGNAILKRPNVSHCAGPPKSGNRSRRKAKASDQGGLDLQPAPSTDQWAVLKETMSRDAETTRQRLLTDHRVDVPAHMAPTHDCKLENCVIGCHYHTVNNVLRGAGLRLAIKDRQNGKKKPVKGKNDRAYLCKVSHGGRCEGSHCHCPEVGLDSDLTRTLLVPTEFISHGDKLVVAAPAPSVSTQSGPVEEKVDDDVRDLFGGDFPADQALSVVRGLNPHAAVFVPNAARMSAAEVAAAPVAADPPIHVEDVAPLPVILEDDEEEEEKDAPPCPELGGAPVGFGQGPKPLEIVDDYFAVRDQERKDMVAEGPLAMRPALIYVAGPSGGNESSVGNFLRSIAGFLLTPIATKDVDIVSDIDRLGVHLTDQLVVDNTTSDSLSLRWNSDPHKTFMRKAGNNTHIRILAGIYQLCERGNIFSNLADRILTNREVCNARALNNALEISQNIAGLVTKAAYDLDDDQAAMKYDADTYLRTIQYCVNRCVLKGVKLVQPKPSATPYFRSAGRWRTTQLIVPSSGSNQ